MFPAGRLPSGTRVVGYRPLRLLCHLLEISPPRRRLRGECDVPQPAELLDELEIQRSADTETLLARAARGLYIYDRASLLLLVSDLFGTRYLPADPELRLVLKRAAAERESTLRRHAQHNNAVYRMNARDSWHSLTLDTKVTANSG
jgi:hypothetical protein